MSLLRYDINKYKVKRYTYKVSRFTKHSRLINKRLEGMKYWKHINTGMNYLPSPSYVRYLQLRIDQLRKDL